MNLAPLSRRRRSGFTLLELLVVVMIIGILAGMAFGAYGAVMRNVRKTQAKAAANDVALAIKGYYSEYGMYPVENQGADEEMESDTTLMAKLVGEDKEANPRAIRFIEPREASEGDPPKNGLVRMGEGASGIYVDPWGEPFQIKLDGDYDGVLQNPDTDAEQKSLNQGVLVWSKGEDRDEDVEGDSPWKDNVTTW